MLDVTVWSHITAAVEKAPLCIDPWPHLYITDIWPADFYELMQDSFPDSDDGRWERLGPAHRELYWIEKDGVFVDRDDSFWAALWEEIATPLREALEGRFEVVGSYTGSELLHDWPGYSIGPHTDTPDKLITGLFYLPKTAEFAKHGTVLYSCATPDPRGKGHKFSSEYKLARTTPYIPNSALFFQRTDFSYHGVLPTPAPVQRWILAFDVFR